MAESIALAALLEDLHRAATDLHALWPTKDTRRALELARQTLGLASRTYARLAGIHAAVEDLKTQ